MSMLKSAIASLPLLLLAPSAQANRDISVAPQQFVLAFREHRSTRTPVQVRLGSRREVYDFSLEKETNQNGNLFSLTVAMHCRCSARDENAMYDKHNWHGIQPFMFFVSDVGAAHDQRVVTLRTLRLRVSMSLRNARLCPGKRNEKQFCEALVDVTLAPTA
jgi:hypothetical protein